MNTKNRPDTEQSGVRRALVDRPLKESLDQVVYEGFRPLAAGLMLIYGVFTAINLTGAIIPDFAFTVIIVMDCVMVSISGAVWFALSRRLVPLRWAHPVGAAIAGLLLTNVLTTLSILGVPYHTVYVVLIVVGAGCFFLSRVWLTWVILVSTISWALVAWRFSTAPEFAYYALSMFAAAILASIVHRARYNSFVRVHELRQADAVNRERLAQSLRESKGLYRQIVETAYEGIGITDRDGIISFVNPRIPEMLDRPVEELIGIPLLDIIHPDDREDAGRRSGAREQSGDEQYECRYLHRDGSVVWCLVSASPLYDSGGEFIGALGLLSDFTPRKQVEISRERYSRRLETLQEVNRAILAAESPRAIGQAVLSRAIELAPCDGACVMLVEPESDTTVVFCDAGRGLEEHALSTADYRTCLTCWSEGGVHDSNIEESGKECVIATRFAPGTVRSLVCEPLASQEGQLGGLLLASNQMNAFTAEHQEIASEFAGTLSLCLRQNHLRHAAESDQQRLDTIVSHLPEGVLVLDQARCVVWINPAAKHILPMLTSVGIGDKLEDLGGVPFTTLLDEGDREGWHSIDIETDETFHFEASAQRLSSDGWGDSYVVVLRDVTQETRVRNQIHAQQRIAAVGQLAAGIAHDFNNILQVILTYAELLRQFPGLADEALEQTDAIIRQTNRASTLVRQILDFSRKSVRSDRAIDLTKLVTELVQLLRRTITEKVSLVLSNADETSKLIVRADPALIQQAITNLVVNAQDAMPHGGAVHIHLGLVEVESGAAPPFPGMGVGSWVEIRVSDTGEGISPDIQSRVYEPFFTTKEPGRGTGLGLAQVYGIVKQHDGFIDLSSPPGQGTTFTIFLPQIMSATDNSAPEPTRLVGRGDGEVVVVVEDEAPLLRIISRALESFDFEVHPVADPKDAVAVCQELGDRVEAVLSDVVMPNLSGPELLLKIRQVCPRARFILMSGYPLDEHLDELSPEVEYQWLQKPFSIRRLVEVVTAVIQT